MPPAVRRKRPSDWVTKTDLTRYVRCPYAFWLLDTGQITFEDTVDDFQITLLEAGNEFQERVEAGAVALDVTPRELPKVLQRDILIYSTPLFTNKELRIRGQPDGIDAQEGALIPIEMKAHKDVHRTDLLELAFYWLLLEPHRTRDPGEPRGRLILRRDDGVEEVEVRIPRHAFDRVHALLWEVRLARTQGVQPRICQCRACSQLKRDDVFRTTIERKDLTLIFGIGRHYARALEAAGIATWEDVLRSDPTAMREALRARTRARSEAEIRTWQHHAESWQRGEPSFFGAEPFAHDAFIALDLEYENFGTVYIVGVCVVHGDEREYITLWASDAKEERRNLRALARLIAEHATLPIVTWSGDSSDVPKLRDAAKRLRLGQLLEPLFARHLDLFCYMRDNVRLPIPSLGLKEVGEYWGVSRISPVHGGFQAERMFSAYRQCRDADRALIRERLEDYSRDDVDALVEIAQRLRGVTTSPDPQAGTAQAKTA